MSPRRKGHNMTDFVQDADIWPTLREEAQRDAEQEPCLAGFLYESVLRHPTLIDALGGLLSHKLASETMSSMTLLALAQEASSFPAKPKPAIENGRYGPLERNVFDLWHPASKRSTPPR